LFKKEKYKKPHIKIDIYKVLLITSIVGIILLAVYTNLRTNKKRIVINKYNITKCLEKGKIGVYIDGQVKKPGYIIVPNGATLEYAINKTGGITKEADIQNIDFKKVLINKEKIIIPKLTNKQWESVETIIVKNDRLININKATLEELVELNGIGEITAQNILKYREKKMFTSIEDILNVKGIGTQKFNKIKNSICV
jgi:competence protein ComEA